MKTVITKLENWSSTFETKCPDCGEEFKKGFQATLVPSSFKDDYIPKTKIVCTACAKKQCPTYFKRRARKKKEAEPELFS